LNQKDIAKKVGVSVATISRVINGEEGVSKSTREKVWKLLEQYAYVRDNNARNLRTAKSKTIGFLISNFSNPFFISIYEGIETVCAERGYTIIIRNTNENVQQEREAIDLFLSYRVAGIIASFVNPQESTLKKLKNYGTCILALDRQQKNIDADTVTMDNFSGASMQVDYLADLGHKRIAVIHGFLTDVVGQDRLNGYLETMKKRKLEILPSYMLCGKYNEEEAYLATMQLMHLNPRPTAIVTHNNMMCIGAYKALKDMNIKIPEEVSLIGFDDFNFSGYLEPSVTLVERSLEKMGEISCKMLIERIENEYAADARVVVLPAKLRINNSCAPVREE